MHLNHLARRPPSRTLTLLLALTALALATSGTALADNFFFSFSDDPGAPVGNFAGTVTGEIFGLVNNSTSAATAIVIDSFPAGLNSFGTYTTPFDVLTNWTGGSLNENSFTETAGVITGGGFELSGANGVNDQFFIDSSCACSSFGLMKGTNFLDIGSNDTKYVWNDNGIGATGVTFTAAGSGSAVPEPTSAGLATLLVLGIAPFVRRKLKA
jgi:hypothetical protein